MTTGTKMDFSALAERHRPEIVAYLTRLLGSAEDAEDVCQDALLRGFRAAGRLAAGSNGRAWLYKIATNSALTFLRRRTRARARWSTLGLDDVPAPADGGTEKSAELEAVARAVERLPPRQRAALVQRRFHEMGYEEIGAALGCTPETARAHVYQAIKKLRRALERSS
jgi:RNA polymerase sigma-70 factor, ECF subfamily